MAEWDEQRAAEIDWERFRTEKLYRALQTERGLPGRLPVGWNIDPVRYRDDLTYRCMVKTRGVTLSPQQEDEAGAAARKFCDEWDAELASNPQFRDFVERSERGLPPRKSGLFLVNRPG